MSRTAIVTLCILLGCCMPTLGEAAPIPAGIIAALRGPAKTVTVVRNGEACVPEVGFLLYAGDRVVVTDPGTTVQVGLFDGRAPLEIDKDTAATHGLIEAGGQPPSFMDNLLHWLAKRLPQKESVKLAALVTRGSDALILSATRPDKQWLADGKRDLAVAWRGGEGPYGVRLSRVEGGQSTLLAQQSDLEREETTLAGVALSPGTYRLEVTGKTQRGAAELCVVPQSKRPGMPAEIASTQLAANIRELLYIAWLQGRDGWKFEAMQQAAQASRTNPAATRILHAMEAGVGEFLN